MKVEYQGKKISIYRLSKLSGCPTTSLYRAYHNGFNTGESLILEAKKHLVKYDGVLITVRKLCQILKSDYRSVKRRIESGMPIEVAVNDLVDRRGNTKSAKLSPSEVLKIYTCLFKKEKCQETIAKEFGVHQSTVSDIWTHRKWGWITAPLRYNLEN